MSNNIMKFLKIVVKTINRNTTLKMILVLLVLTVCLMVFLSVLGQEFSRISDVGTTLDVNYFYSARYAQSFFEQISPEAVNLYLYRFAVADTFFPICYSLFFSFLISHILKKKQPKSSRSQYLCLVPFVTVFFDYSENIFTIIAMRSLPDINMFLVRLLSISSSIKWVTFLSIILVLLWLIIKKQSETCETYQ